MFVVLRTSDIIRSFTNKYISMINIKVLGPGCAKCQTTYQNVLEAVKLSGVEAHVEKIENIEEMLKYNILVTPVVMINNEAKIKGRVADISELKKLLTA